MLKYFLIGSLVLTILSEILIGYVNPISSIAFSMSFFSCFPLSFCLLTIMVDLETSYEQVQLLQESIVMKAKILSSGRESNCLPHSSAVEVQVTTTAATVRGTNLYSKHTAATVPVLHKSPVTHNAASHNSPVTHNAVSSHNTAQHTAGINTTTTTTNTNSLTIERDEELNQPNNNMVMKYQVQSSTNPTLKLYLPSNFTTFYKIIHVEIQRRYEDTWVVNTSCVVTAALNIFVLYLLMTLIFASVVTGTLTIFATLTLLLKEVVFLFIVFQRCAQTNSLVDAITTQLGLYGSDYPEVFLPTYIYATLFPISFRLAKYRITWQQFIVQVTSVVLTSVIGVVKAIFESYNL